jgi:hypothetical protein
MVGLPDTPLPSATLKPVVPAWIVRGVTVVPEVFATKPVEAFARLAGASARARTSVDPDPLSVRLKPNPEAVN